MNPFISFIPKKSTINPNITSSYLEENKSKRSRNYDNSLINQQESLCSVTNILMDIDNHVLELKIDDDKSISSKNNNKTNYDKKHSIISNINDVNFDNPLLYQKLNIESNFDLTSLVSDNKQPENNNTLKVYKNFKLQQKNYIYPLDHRKIDPYEIQDYISNHINKSKFWSTTTATITNESIIVETNLEHTLQYVRLRLLYWQEAIHSVLNNLYEANQQSSNNNMNYLDNYIYILGETMKNNEYQSKLYMPMSYYSAYIYPTVVKDTIDFRCIIIGINKTIFTRLHQLGIGMYELVSNDNDINHNNKHHRNEKQNISTVGLLKLSKQGRNILLFGKYSISMFINVIIEYIFGMLDNSNHTIQSQNIDVPIILSNLLYLHSSSIIYTNIPILCQYNFNRLKMYGIDSINNNNNNKSSNNKKLILESLDYSNPSMLPIHKVSMTGFIACKDRSIITLIELLIHLSNDCYNLTLQSNTNNKLSTYNYLSNQLLNYSYELKPISIKNNITTTLNNLGAMNTSITNPTTLLNPMQLLTTTSMKYNIDDIISTTTTTTNDAKDDHKSMLPFSQEDNHMNNTIIKNNNNSNKNKNDNKSNTSNNNTNSNIYNQYIPHEVWIQDKRLGKFPYFTIQFIISSNHNMLPQKKLFSYASRNDIDIDKDLNHFINITPYDVIEEIRWYDDSYDHNIYNTINTTSNNNNNNNSNNSNSSCKIEIVYRTLEPMQLQRIEVNNQIDYTATKSTTTVSVDNSSPIDIGLQKDGSILLQPLNVYSIYAND